MPEYQINKIIVHPSVVGATITDRIIGRLPGIPVEIRDYPEGGKRNGSLSAGISRGKRILFITKKKWTFSSSMSGHSRNDVLQLLCDRFNRKLSFRLYLLLSAGIFNQQFYLSVC